MNEITDQEFEEYQLLKAQYGRDTILKSIASLECVRDDIDAPVRSIIAKLSLLGCRTTWSCCGYDYVGQPIHKRHTYGSAYVRMIENEHSYRVVSSIVSSGIPWIDTWEWQKIGPEEYILKNNWQSLIIGEAPWQSEDVHFFGEIAQIRLSILDAFLTTLSDDFAVAAILMDENEIHHQAYPLWQYPILKPWNIFKKDWVPA